MKIFACLLAAAALLLAADSKLGKPLTLKSPVAVDTVLANPATYLNKTVQVKGKITSVCQEMGCWMELAGDSGKTLRIKVEDGAIVFPKDGAGRTAIAEGKLVKIDAAAAASEHAEHHKDAKPADSATAKPAAYQIAGTGAIILE
jgi:hypothetical protein